MISKIVLNNFCAYKGCNELVFEPSKLVSLISSGNGEGKSTIFNALLWCLYGTVPEGMSKTQLVNHIICLNEIKMTLKPRSIHFEIRGRITVHTS